MRILVVASYNSGRFSPFVIEQSQALTEAGIEIDFFGISGKGTRGYYNNRVRLLKKIKDYQPDIIHAHYGLSGLLANMQRKVPVLTTFHGSDIHSSKRILALSKMAMRLSAYNIFVGQSLYDIAKCTKNYSILSCGLDLPVIRPVDLLKARELLGWKEKQVYILFSGSFNNPVKNYALAKKGVELVGNCKLIELKGYNKQEVNLLMNACNLLLTTSFKESGPLVVKEAMACNRPIVSVDVGDVKWVIGNTKGCYITSYQEGDCVDQIKKAIRFSLENKQTNGRDRIIEIGLDNKVVAQKLVIIYNSVLSNSKK